MKKSLGIVLVALSIGWASTSSMAGKTSQTPAAKQLALADSTVVVAGMGTTTNKQYGLDLRRCASMSGAEKASCISFAKHRHGDI